MDLVEASTRYPVREACPGGVPGWTPGAVAGQVGW